MAKPLIITIGREYGSGGHEIGEIVAKKMNMGFYDRKLIEYTANKTGYSEKTVASNEQIIHRRAANGVFPDFLLHQYLPIEDDIFVSTVQAINKIASSESAVIIGRCADYILHGRPNVLNFYVFADIEERIKRIGSNEQISEYDALKKIIEKDKERGNHYFRFTNQKWGKAQNYNYCMNSSVLGIEKTADLIAEIARFYVAVNAD